MTRKGRELTEAEKALWRRITQTIDPLDQGKKLGRAEQPHSPIRSFTRKPSQVVVEPQAPLPFIPHPLTHQLKRIRKVKVEARLDLHGLTRDQAHLRLRRFLESCQHQGYIWVLIITGKGQRIGSRSSRGILHGLVPQWLEDPALRPFISGYATAKPYDGGEGALYVRIKRKKSVPACLL
jgi:DNA-nicking Smr family endonuclease